MARPAQPLTRNRLIVAILMNQLATPGLGSLMARYYWAGAGQLILAVAGCGLVMVWLCRLFYTMSIDVMNDKGTPTPSDGWMWTWGASLFIVSWIWSLITSVQMWMRAPREEPKVPPVIQPPSTPQNG
jgi:hypothetical protein